MAQQRRGINRSIVKSGLHVTTKKHGDVALNRRGPKYKEPRFDTRFNKGRQWPPMEERVVHSPLPEIPWDPISKSGTVVSEVLSRHAKITGDITGKGKIA